MGVDFLAAFASIVLTFLAGAEVDPDLLKSKFKESALIGGVSFAVPFALAWAFAQFVLGWDLRAAQIAGVALSTTSLAVVYAVLVETGLTNTETGKLLMAATFVTDTGTAAALSILFIRPTAWLVVSLACPSPLSGLCRACTPGSSPATETVSSSLRSKAPSRCFSC
jgi:Kef-type K+ transport system membrane component KefB